ncbi:MAG TPA: 3-oxoacyl-[acyl-carrier-protein] synthase III C-terminal domain-containing protein [Mycobacteriales bacterium]|nr:3-oxoacyl-[acyl-carrier-protein] synthase III C-terminal domain-containing protein [Mycobacteriales bacterium]
MGHALPAPYSQQSVWDGFFARHFQDVPLAEQLFTRSGVRTRHTVANPVYEDVSQWGTAARMERYLAEALPLGKDAVATALADAGLAAADVGLFAVASCTGYVTPGVDIRLARDLGMSDRVRRLFVGHMGCYAAIPGLGSVADFTAARGRPSVLLCLELTSLHIQPPTTDVDQVVAHALFADAAAAVVLQPSDGPGFEVVDVVAQTDPSTAEYMTWDVTDLGFRMGLSPRVPAVLARHVRGVVDELLAAHDLTLSDVDGWAVHPGGRRILEVVQRRLELPDGALEHSYGVLRDQGNCSSATVLLVLERMRAAGTVEPGRHLVALAFGPGLTLYAALLRAV